MREENERKVAKRSESDLIRYAICDTHQERGRFITLNFLSWRVPISVENVIVVTVRREKECHALLIIKKGRRHYNTYEYAVVLLSSRPLSTSWNE